MPYVERDGGTIVGVFGRPQSFTSEWVADDDPEVVVYKSHPPTPVADRVKASLSSDAVLSALVRKLAKDAGIAEKDLVDSIAAEAKDVGP
jgi:hypothetical protein